jgi:hypothetical protein
MLGRIVTRARSTIVLFHLVEVIHIIIQIRKIFHTLLVVQVLRLWLYHFIAGLGLLNGNLQMESATQMIRNVKNILVLSFISMLFIKTILPEASRQRVS